MSYFDIKDCKEGYIRVNTPRNEAYKTVDNWLSTKLEGSYLIEHIYFITFELESDALLFKLRFPK